MVPYGCIYKLLLLSVEMHQFTCSEAVQQVTKYVLSLRSAPSIISHCMQGIFSLANCSQSVTPTYCCTATVITTYIAVMILAI